ncbi:hypothetical protein T484DRAFT_1770962 [Baffinella frigidus]|nr:hypothetical protein T484DRAFT_1770962 [Cryptophyta sp. CCMP2293]
MSVDIAELIRQASFSLSPAHQASLSLHQAGFALSHASADSPVNQFIELYQLKAQREAAHRQPCLQETRYRRRRHGKILRKSLLFTIWEVDEAALARHEVQENQQFLSVSSLSFSSIDGMDLHKMDLPSSSVSPPKWDGAFAPSDWEMADPRRQNQKRGRTSDAMTVEPAWGPCTSRPPATLRVSSAPPTMADLLQVLQALKRPRSVP